MLSRLHAAGTRLADVLVDSGYAHRRPEHFAAPVRALGAALVMDLHPHDRGPHGTHAGAICSNGRLHCPATPPSLLAIAPLGPGPDREQTLAHDQRTAEAARYVLPRLTGEDADGYHRVRCPAVAGKIRCPHRPASMALPMDRPQILTPPEHPPTCCTQASVSVPASVNTKTAQKHDYPSRAWRASYARRSGAERANATLKDPAAVSIRRGWCRLTGVTANSLMLAGAVIARNTRAVDAYQARQADNARRVAAGLPPKTRRRRRTSLTDLAAPAASQPRDPLVAVPA